MSVFQEATIAIEIGIEIAIETAVNAFSYLIQGIRKQSVASSIQHNGFDTDPDSDFDPDDCVFQKTKQIRF